jgi:hypothetical protein
VYAVVAEAADGAICPRTLYVVAIYAPINKKASSPPLAVAWNDALPAPSAVSTVLAAAAPEVSLAVPTAPAEIAADPTEDAMSWLDPTEFALRWVESMLPATMDTVEVPDAVSTDAGDVPITALT